MNSRTLFEIGDGQHRALAVCIVMQRIGVRWLGHRFGYRYSKLWQAHILYVRPFQIWWRIRRYSARQQTPVVGASIVKGEGQVSGSSRSESRP